MGNRHSLSEMIIKNMYSEIEDHISNSNRNLYISTELLRNPKGNKIIWISEKIITKYEFLTFAVNRGDVKLVETILHYVSPKNSHLVKAYKDHNYEVIKVIGERVIGDLKLDENMIKDRQLVNILLKKNVNSLMIEAIKYNKNLALEIINDGYKINENMAFTKAIWCDELDIALKLEHDEDCYKIAVARKSKNVIHLFKPNMTFLNDIMVKAFKKSDISMVEFLLDIGCDFKYVGIELSRHAHKDEAYMLIKKLINTNKIDIKTINDVDETMKTIAYKNNDLRLLTLLKDNSIDLISF